MTTKKRYMFHCGRWLARKEDDGSTVRELPAEGDDIRKPQPGDIPYYTVFHKIGLLGPLCFLL